MEPMEPKRADLRQRVAARGKAPGSLVLHTGIAAEDQRSLAWADRKGRGPVGRARNGRIPLALFKLSWPYLGVPRA